MTMLRVAVAALVADALPDIGSGQTARRWLTLHEWARRGSVSVARLAEAHVDAIGILTEARRTPNPGSIYAVWAAAGPDGAGPEVSAEGFITGTKPFCSGIGVADRALMTAIDSAGDARLVEIDLCDGSTWSGDTTTWATPALADTATGTASFERHRVEAMIGTPNWYLDRPGFWHGAIGPAACWAGAAAGVVDHAEAHAGRDPHARTALGALRAEAHLLQSVLDTAGRRCDEHPDDRDRARFTAHTTRHLVERSAHRIVDEFGRSHGPRPFVGDAELNQRILDLHLYTRQHHGDRDLESLGCLAPMPHDHD